MSGLQWKIGRVTVARVEEQATAIPALAFLPSATPELLDRHAEWMAPWAFDGDNLVLSIQALCVESDGRKVVVDTCVGQRPLPEMFGQMADDGSFLTALDDAGFGRETVDTVICTHLHFDHVGWNTMLVDGQWVPTFPNARYVIARREYEHWRDASTELRNASSAVTFDDAVTPLFDPGVVDLVDVDHAVTSEIALEPTPGHTPGHVSVRIRSLGEEAIITGDCVHSAIQFAEPQCGLIVDTDPDGSAATRRRLVDDCVDRPVLVIGTHFPPPTAGHLITTPTGVRFRPLA